MKKLILTFLLAMGLTAFTQDAVKKHYPVHPSKMAEFNEKTGGLVEPPNDNRKVIFLDARVSDASPLTNLTASATLHMGFGTEVRKMKIAAEADLYQIAKEVRQTGAGAVIFFVEKENYPTLSVFPEDAITIVNVKPFQNPDYPTYRRRLVKEFWRSLSFTLGGYSCGGQSGSVMQPVFSVAELDAIRGFSLPPMQIGCINATKPKLKIFNINPVPYSRACREGWAPAPTNEVQKSVYERLRDSSSRFSRDFPARPRDPRKLK